MKEINWEADIEQLKTQLPKLHAMLKQKKQLQNWVTNHLSKFEEMDRTATRTSNKPRVEHVTFHGLRHYAAQIESEEYKNNLQSKRVVSGRP